MSTAGSVLFLAISFALCETIWPMIFPWNLGYVWIWSRIPIYHWADVIGFSGLSALTVAFNAVIFFAWQIRKNKKRAWTYVGFVVAAILILSATGFARNQKWKVTDKVASILAIQANIGNLEKYWQDKGDQYQDFITDKYISLATEARAAHPDANLIVFPETAIPIDLDLPFAFRPINQRFLESIRKIGIPALVGAYSGDPLFPKRVWNAVFSYGRLGDYVDIYRKNILLAFGEYFPGADTFPILKEIVPAISDFGRGSEIKVLRAGDLIVGPQICYEGLYDYHSRALSEKGAQIFFNATNDSWYGRPSEPYQHLFMTFARAIEFRRPLMRVTNTGITTAILADGTILEYSPQNQEWYHQFDIAYLERPAPTLFEKWGKFVPHVLLLALSLIFFWGRSERSKTY